MASKRWNHKTLIPKPTGYDTVNLLPYQDVGGLLLLLLPVLVFLQCTGAHAR